MRKLKRCSKEAAPGGHAINTPRARSGLPLPVPVERLLDALVERLFIEIHEKASDAAHVDKVIEKIKM